MLPWIILYIILAIGAARYIFAWGFYVVGVDRDELASALTVMVGMTLVWPLALPFCLMKLFAYNYSRPNFKPMSRFRRLFVYVPPRDRGHED